MPADKKLTLGITLGDVRGIGPEVTLKALAAMPADDTRFLLLGDPALVDRLNKQLGLSLEFDSVGSSSRISVFNPGPTIPSGDIDPNLGAAAALAGLHEAAKRCLSGDLDGMITAPVNKENIIRAGNNFVGQTELLSQLGGTDRTAMMLLGHDAQHRWLRVVLATTHISIRRLPDRLTKENIELAIELAADSCRLLNLPRARVAVCGLNPHAGEGGALGTEEQTIVRPAVEACVARGIDAHGPFAADALFYYVFRGDYDVVVAMYHDQGLVPLKMIGFETGVNWTLGLPFIRTSPDHGTAYDIAGKGIAQPSSMMSAIRLAQSLARKKTS